MSGSCNARCATCSRGLDPFAHVAAVRHDRTDVRIVEQVGRQRLEVPPAAVLVADTELDASVGPASAHQPVERLLDAFAVVTVDEVVDVQSDRSISAKPSTLTDDGLTQVMHAVLVEQADHVGRVLDDRLEPPPPTLQDRFGLVFGGDVLGEADEVRDGCVLIADGGHARAAPHERLRRVARTASRRTRGQPPPVEQSVAGRHVLAARSSGWRTSHEPKLQQLGPRCGRGTGTALR